MEDIGKIKKKYIRVISNKFYSKKIDELTESELHKCSLVSEMLAYVYSVIPEGFGKYSIFDFNGFVINKSDDAKIDTLPPSVSLLAKEKICKFCWGKSWEEINKKHDEDSNIEIFLRKSSIMMKRVEAGSNVVIFGNSDKPIGRTMIASIIMKEAIRQRVTRLARWQAYDWIDFAKLFSIIGKDSIELADYRSCDWLVVDNIIRKIRSPAQRTLLIDLIDPFFIDRYNNKLPTILVFKFDIRDKSLDMEKLFGIGISKIIDSKRTFKIPLCEEIK